MVQALCATCLVPGKYVQLKSLKQTHTQMGFVVSRFTGFGALQRFHEAQVSGSIEVRQGQSESPE